MEAEANMKEDNASAQKAAEERVKADDAARVAEKAVKDDAINRNVFCVMDAKGVIPSIRCTIVVIH
jgi:hypothetical protein